ncbi:uncharacterized protein Tco025E_06832 [Trypanosoma conorhini]|uniref:Uncharacterized protein n=1 Tax=Trypanosoma conorhini TaxID=83891 RepID=A0A3R7RRB9_9TRYP|nr:uncharacterized protein Tco025E_06832 [Trypanosoma conorhini]RNF11226.1 hypothetical protein Tco025E_06832 [Trypanosoma conorhini]
MRRTASGARLSNDEVLAELSSTMLPDRKPAAKIVVEPPSLSSRGEDDMPRGGTKSDASPRAEIRGDGVPKESGATMIQELRQNKAKNVRASQELKLGQGNVIDDMNVLQRGLQSHLVGAAKQSNLSEGQTCGLQAILEANLGEPEPQLSTAEAGWTQFVFTELRTVKQRLEEEMRGLKAHHEAQMGALLEKVSEQFGHVNQLISQLLTALHSLRQNESKANKLEVFPPDDSLPGGEEKVQLVVSIPSSTESPEVLLPISVNATVGMCKRELLRRIHQQCLVSSDVSYSNVVLLQDTRTLYEEDVLRDVLVPGPPNASSSGELVKLTLRTVLPKPIHGAPSTEEEVCAPTASSTVPQNAASSNSFHSAAAVPKHGGGKQTPVQTNEGTSQSPQPSSSKRHFVPITSTQAEDFGMLRVEDVDEISGNEALYRRLVTELERSEREGLVKEEKLHCVVAVKEGLTRIRIYLLDRAVYSPVEVHRRVARSALEELLAASAPGATLEEMSRASSMAQTALQSISSTHGEDSRVAAVQEGMRAAQDRKQQTIDEIKELCENMTYRLRIPSNMLKRAESLTQDAQRALILAPSMTQKELDEIHESLVDFSRAASS